MEHTPNDTRPVTRRELADALRSAAVAYGSSSAIDRAVNFALESLAGQFDALDLIDKDRLQVVDEPNEHYDDHHHDWQHEEGNVWRCSRCMIAVNYFPTVAPDSTWLTPCVSVPWLKAKVRELASKLERYEATSVELRGVVIDRTDEHAALYVSAQSVDNERILLNLPVPRGARVAAGQVWAVDLRLGEPRER